MLEEQAQPKERSDFERFLANKEKELQGELDRLEDAFRFFSWWKKSPDGGRTIYAEHRAFDMFEDVKKEQAAEIEKTLYYNEKEFALKIDAYRYLVVRVSRKPSERVRSWSVETLELDPAFRD